MVSLQRQLLDALNSKRFLSEAGSVSASLLQGGSRAIAATAKVQACLSILHRGLILSKAPALPHHLSSRKEQADDGVPWKSARWHRSDAWQKGVDKVMGGCFEIWM